MLEELVARVVRSVGAGRDDRLDGACGLIIDGQEHAETHARRAD